MPNPHFHRAFVLSSLFLLAGSSLAGCGKAPQDKLAGKWVGDRIDNVSADQVARATGWVKGTTFEFEGDKLTVTLPAESPRKGTYKVSRVDGDKMVLSVARPDGSNDQASVTMREDKSLSWDIGQGREVRLVRTQ